MKVRIVLEGWVEMKKAAVQHIANCEANDLCVACGQPISGDRVVRGCHQRCAKATYRAIESGKTTDKERVEQGKWLPASPGGRTPTNPVSVEIARGA